MIEVKVKKEFNRGRGWVKVTGFQALGKKQLPIDYIYETPCVYKERGNLVVKDGHNTKVIKPGDKFRDDKWQKICQTISLAGNKLANLNRKLEKEKLRWNEEKIYTW